MRRVILALCVSFAAVAAATCSSSTQNVTAPSTVKCAVTAVATPSAFSPSGGAGTVSISTNRECQWSAAAASGWIQLGGSPSGQGDGTLSFKVSANGDPTVRKGSIAVGDQQLGITQDAASCTFAVDPRSDSIGSAGGRRTIAVTASSSQCTWTARTSADWLAVVDGAQGSGNGRVTYEAREATGPGRSGALQIAGQVVTITQGEGCTTSIAPTAQNAPAGGGSGTIAVTTAAGCSWSARSDVPWIAIASGQSGAGPGSVAFNVSASDGPSRSGTLTIDGHVFTVSQASGCRYTLDPPSQAMTDAGGTGSFTVHAGSGCAWTASSQASWIALAGTTSGSGTGTVSFSIPPNPMGIPARTGTIAVNDQIFTVEQAAGVPCVYTLTPSSQDFPSGGGAGSFTVSTVLTCPWSVTPSDSWITIVGSPAGAGVGTVQFSVAENPAGSPARTGTIGVRGPVFTIRQGPAPTDR